jgi:hypothetical protein
MDTAGSCSKGDAANPRRIRAPTAVALFLADAATI